VNAKSNHGEGEIAPKVWLAMPEHILYLY